MIENNCNYLTKSQLLKLIESAKDDELIIIQKPCRGREDEMHLSFVDSARYVNRTIDGQNHDHITILDFH